MSYLRYCVNIPSKGDWYEYNLITGFSVTTGVEGKQIIHGYLINGIVGLESENTSIAVSAEFQISGDELVEWFIGEFTNRTVIDISKFTSEEAIVFDSTGKILSKKVDG